VGTFDYDKDYAIRVKPITTAPKTPNIPQGRDTFQTPNYATDLLIPFIPKNIKIIWECAAGEGKIVKRLENAGFSVWSTDIRYNPDWIDEQLNFITDTPNILGECIITNPPFSIREKFIEKAFEYNLPFAFLINADYSQEQISWIQRGCEKIIPNRRIDFITPTGRNGKTSSSQFHSMWLTYKFNLGKTETFVDLPIKEKKENI
jgi:hypothetical protein